MLYHILRLELPRRADTRGVGVARRETGKGGGEGWVKSVRKLILALLLPSAAAHPSLLNHMLTKTSSPDSARIWYETITRTHQKTCYKSSDVL